MPTGVEVFKRFLDTVKPDDLPKLDEVVALVLASEGEAGIIRRLDNGTLHRAVSGLPTGAIEIARETQSLEAALQWSAVAGDSLGKVVEFEIYRQRQARHLHQGEPAEAAGAAGPGGGDPPGRACSRPRAMRCSSCRPTS